MSNRKPLEEQIKDAQADIDKKRERINKLISKQRKKERNERTNRLCTRAGLLESMLPDTKKLTDEEFGVFLKRTTANDFGRRILKEMLPPEVKKPDETEGNTANVKADDAVSENTQTAQNGGAIAVDNGGNNAGVIG